MSQSRAERVKEAVQNNRGQEASDAPEDAAAKLPGQGTGQFYLVREREVAAVQSEPSRIATAQVPEDRVLELARAARQAGG
jgi:hypothetical protein